MPAERVGVKSRGDFADTLGMSITSTPTDIWFLVALIAVVTVVMCLSVLGALVEREQGLRQLGEDVRELKRRYTFSFSEPDEMPPALAELSLPSSGDTRRDVPER